MRHVSSTPGGDGLVQGLVGIVVGALHAGVQVDFLVAGQHALLHQHPRFIHRPGSRLALPGIGTQMVAAEDDALAGESDSFGDVVHESHEIARRHTCVAAELVHLVAGGFDEDRGVASQRLP